MSESYSLSDIAKMSGEGTTFSLADVQAMSPKASMDLRGEGFEKLKNYSPANTIGGLVRGAGSIGATLMAPFDYAEGKLRDLIAGPQTGPSLNQQRRTDMDAGLQALGADPTSQQYQNSKLTAEIGGSLGVGGAGANVLANIPAAAKAAPHLINAIRSGGMTTGAAPGASRVADMGVRVAGGAINGALTAGASDQANAGDGMMIGGGFPLVTKTLGAAGNAVGSAFRGGPGANPTTLQTARESMDAGYVIPPNMLKPTFKNGVLESIGGKQAVEQFASTANTKVTEKLTRQALGLADDVPLTKGTMEDLRRTAGKAYAEVSNLSPQASADLEALKLARNESQGWFNAYNRSASPNDLKLAKQFKAEAEALETALEAHATAAKRPELIPALRDARKEIAKTYTVGRALNDATGTVNAKVLGRMYEKGLPLSDGLDVAGKFAAGFPRAAMPPQQVGSVGVHNLKAGLSTALGGAGMISAGPIGMAAAAVPFVAPPLARSIMFSKAGQQGLLNQGGQGLLSRSIDDALPLMYRTNALLGSR